MKTSEKILKFIEEEGEATPKQITTYSGTTNRAVFKQLAKMTEAGKLIKIGKPPKVFYKISIEKDKTEKAIKLDQAIEKEIEQNFLYVTPLGEYFSGKKGFIKWCEERKLNIAQQAKQYSNMLARIYRRKDAKVIIATDKFKDTFSENFLKEVFYIDFYSIPQFGKTKLGQLLLYAKQSQDKKRIKEISNIVRDPIDYVIKKYKIDAIGYIPPTVRREVQFMKELEKNLNLPLPQIKLTKIKTEIIVPQKTLNKIRDRITNAKNTIMVEDKRSFNNVLLIDDAAGSGASLNETAKKLLNSGIANKVYGLTITGSYKGFDVISEI
ncbi:hypothetical protein JW978_00370 [Candidatus Dojkabacteria bacterium]|nr:hypothetical protein [Candidatus Dojkabacteria bacterium]